MGLFSNKEKPEKHWSDYRQDCADRMQNDEGIDLNDEYWCDTCDKWTSRKIAKDVGGTLDNVMVRCSICNESTTEMRDLKGTTKQNLKDQKNAKIKKYKKKGTHLVTLRGNYDGEIEKEFELLSEACDEIISVGEMVRRRDYTVPYFMTVTYKNN